MTEKLNKNAKDPAVVDRVILGKDESIQISNWVNEFNARSDGLVKISKSDLVNFLISTHPETLSQTDIRTLSQKHFDETKWLSWSIAKIKEAKRSGKDLSFADLSKSREFLFEKVPKKKNEHKNPISESVADKNDNNSDEV